MVQTTFQYFESVMRSGSTDELNRKCCTVVEAPNNEVELPHAGIGAGMYPVRFEVGQVLRCIDYVAGGTKVAGKEMPIQIPADLAAQIEVEWEI